MPIELSTQLIHASIAQVLHEVSPEAEIFDNPNQQGTPYPAWFIVHRSPVEIKREIRRYYITYYIDVWYMIKQNITQMFDKYTEVAEVLSDKLEYVPLYGYPGIVLHTFETSWSLEMTAMKYSLTLRLVCSKDNGVPIPKMEVIEDFSAFIKGLGLLKKIHYLCSQFPQFDMGIETMEYCRYGNSITLPIVSGIYRDSDGIRWEPLAWNVGQMGDTFGPVLDDMTINLFMGEVIGLDTCIGGTVGVGENVGKDIVWRIQGMTRTDWRANGPIRALETDAGVSGSADLSMDEWVHRGPAKAMAGEPIMGGTVEPYNPGPEIKIGYLGSGGTGAPFISYGFETRSLWSGDSRIPYDGTKTYTLVSVHGYGGAMDSVTNWSLTSGTNNSLALHRIIAAGYTVFYVEYTEV